MRPEAFDAAMVAARAGAIPELVALLRAHATLAFHVADDGRTLLTAAAANGRGGAVRALLIAGVPADLEDGAGDTALSVAVADRWVDVVLALAEQDLTHGDALQDLAYALDDDDPPPVDPALLARRTPLAALRERRASLAAVIAADDADAVDAFDPVVFAVPDADGRTAVTQAIAERRTAVLDLLTRRMDAPWGADDTGQTPLACAESTGDADIVATVLGASPLAPEQARLRTKFGLPDPDPPAPEARLGFDVGLLEATAAAALGRITPVGALRRLLVDASTVYAELGGEGEAPVRVTVAELAHGFDDDLYQDHLDADDAARATSAYKRAMLALLERLAESDAARTLAGGAAVAVEVLEHVH